MNDYKFGNFIYEQRTAKGLSQAQLGEMLGVSNKAVSKWESGAAKPQTAKLFRLAQILEVSVEELLAGERLEKTEPTVSTSHYASLLLQRFQRTRRTASVLGWIVLGVILQIPIVSGILLNLGVSDNVGAAYAGISILVFLITLIAWIVNRTSTRSQKKLLDDLQITVPNKPFPTNLPPKNHSSSSFEAIDAILQYEFLNRKYIFVLLILIFIPLCATLLLALFGFFPAISGFAVFIYFANVWIPIVWYASITILIFVIVSISRTVKMRKNLIHTSPDAWTAHIQEKTHSQKEKKRRLTDLFTLGWIFLSILHLFIASSMGIFLIYSIVLILSYVTLLIRFYPQKSPKIRQDPVIDPSCE